MNRNLQNYIRQSFPEHSELTVSEIFAIKHTEINFMNDIYTVYDSSLTINSIIIKDLFFIDLAEFFDRNKEKYIYDFINENSFYQSFNFGDGKFGVNFHLHNDISHSKVLFFNNNLRNNEISVSYNDENLKYNKINFDNLMFKYIDFIKNNHLRSEIIFTFLYGYIKNNTDLSDFFLLSPLISKNTKIRISEYSSMCPALNNNQDKNINIYHKRHNFYISDQDYNILLKKDLRFVAKSNFYNEIIKPFKDILTHFDNLKKIDFSNTWEKDVHNYLSGILVQKDKDSVKVNINLPEFKSEFLDKIIYSQRPVIELSFILNNKVVSYLKMDGNYDYHNKDIIEAYQSYKELAEINSQNIELQNLIIPEEFANKKKRI
jgi:hypothetical protein